jgi:TolB-like protein/Flp pilus assembly protein TadD
MPRFAAFLSELRRRRVYHVGVVYAGAAFIAAQAADTFLPRLGFPDWTVTLVVLLAVLGFPVAVILGWVFDITAGGIRRTGPAMEPLAQAPPAARIAGAAVVALIVVAAAGWWLAGVAFGPPSTIHSIAVLPLENLTGDAGQQYFVDGMHEALTAELSKIGALTVISRTSAMFYRHSNRPLREIARELGATGLIEGSVARDGDHVRVTVRLVHGPSDRHLWGASFDREARNILALQSDVARAIADRLRVVITPHEEARLTASPVDPDAHDHYLRGRFHWNRRGEDGLNRALRHFQQAIELDPAYAAAYAGLADVYVVRPSWGFAAPTDGYPRAAALARRALELDSNLAGPHATLAMVARYYDRDVDAAAAHFERALERDPSHATARQWYGSLLISAGRFDEAIEQLQQARRLDPLAPNIGRWLGAALHYAGRHAEAEAELRRTADTHPDFHLLHVELARIHATQGRVSDALAALDRARGLAEVDPDYGYVGWVYGRIGHGDEARQILGRLHELSAREYVDPGAIALVHVGLGENAETLRWLQRAVDEPGNFRAGLLAVDPAFAPLRQDPAFRDGFRELLRRMKLPLHDGA